MKYLRILVCGLALQCSALPATANWLYTPGAGPSAFVSFNSGTTPAGTSLCAAANTDCLANVPINLAGNPLFVTGNAGLVTGTGGTFPVTGTVTANAGTGTMTVTGAGGTFPVTGTFFQATQPISAASLPLPTGAMQQTGGSVTANAGTNLNTSLLALESGGNIATLAGAITAARMQVNVSQVAGTALGTPVAWGSTPSGNVLSANVNCITGCGAGSGTVNPTTIGTWGIMSGTVPGTAPTNTGIVGGIYNSTPPTLTTGQTAPFQFDANGNVKMNVVAGGAGGGAVTVANGADTAEGTTTDALCALPTSGTACTVIALLKVLNNTANTPAQITSLTRAARNFPGCTVGASSGSCLAANTAVVFVQVENTSATASIACAWGATAVLNSAGSFQLGPLASGSWGPNTGGVPAGALNCIASAASTPMYLEWN